MNLGIPTDPQPSLVRGMALADEPGLGALTIPSYLREVADRFGPREALAMPLGDRVERWSYADLWERSVEVARALIAAGLRKDGRVGLLMSNRLEYLSCVFGTALAGGVTVALSTFSTAQELDYLLETSAVSILLFERRVVKQDFAAMLETLEPAIARGPVASTRFPFLDRIVALQSVSAMDGLRDEPPLGGGFEPWPDFLAAGATVAAERVTARAATVTPSDVGMLFFSSGTTSLPKGILHAQRAIAVQWWRWPRCMGVDPARVPVRSWTGNGFFWSGNLSMVLGTALSTGGTIVLQPVFEARQALELMERERVTFPIGRPHQWARLAECPRWAQADLGSLHYVTYSDTLFAHPTVSSDWKTPMSFGTTETLTIVTSLGELPVDERTIGGHGAPLPGNTLKIFDPLTRAVVPRGTRGEIAIKGPTLMIGYVGKTPDQTFDEDGYFCTGDGGYVDDRGRLFWEGRLTDIIKTGGANVSPVEVDAALATYPGVKRTQTVGVPHETLSEIVVACIVPHDDRTLDRDAIHAFLKERLASYKLPRAILFFREDELTVTGSEKIKTGALRALAQARLAGPAPRDAAAAS